MEEDDLSRSRIAYTKPRWTPSCEGLAWGGEGRGGGGGLKYRSDTGFFPF